MQIEVVPTWPVGDDEVLVLALNLDVRAARACLALEQPLALVWAEPPCDQPGHSVGSAGIASTDVMRFLGRKLTAKGRVYGVEQTGSGLKPPGLACAHR